VHRPQLLRDDQRLSPQRVASLVMSAGKPAQALPSAEEIAKDISARAGAGDVVLVMSNGSFDELCARLLQLLRQREGQP
jgi:UDP-N-acetylmuramate-alanine ligase